VDGGERHAVMRRRCIEPFPSVTRAL
jgi:hypothetical protein